MDEKVVLRISAAELEKIRDAEKLYDEGREEEALKLIDEVLNLPDDPNEAISYLKNLLANKDVISFDEVKKEDDRWSMDVKIGGGFIPYIMQLRGMCFSALMDKGFGIEILEKAVSNAYLMKEVFPNSWVHLALTGQIFLAIKEFDKAEALFQEAIELAPPDELMPKRCMDLLKRKKIWNHR